MIDNTDDTFTVKIDVLRLAPVREFHFLTETVLEQVGDRVVNRKPNGEPKTIKPL